MLPVWYFLFEHHPFIVGLFNAYPDIPANFSDPLPLFSVARENESANRSAQAGKTTATNIKHKFFAKKRKRLVNKTKNAVYEANKRNLGKKELKRGSFSSTLPIRSLKNTECWGYAVCARHQAWVNEWMKKCTHTQTLKSCVHHQPWRNEPAHIQRMCGPLWRLLQRTTSPHFSSGPHLFPFLKQPWPASIPSSILSHFFYMSLAIRFPTRIVNVIFFF